MYTKNFKQLSKSDVSASGGKGASLGEMTQAGNLVEVDANSGTVKILEPINGNIRINPEEWEFEFQQRNNQPVLMADFWSRAVKDLLPKDLKLKNIHLDYLFTNHSKGYVKKEQKASVLNKIFEAIKKDGKYVNYAYNGTIKAVNDF
jgi:hypothetical protein